MPRKPKPRLPRWCEICGNSIPWAAGHPAKTCGMVCHKIRVSKKEVARYHTIKDSAHYKETRAAYLQQLKKAMDDDPEFAAIQRAHHAATMARFKARTDADPAKRAELLAKKRAWQAAQREAMEQNPEAFEKHKAEARAWYAALSQEDRARIYYGPRANKALKNLLPLASALAQKAKK